MPVATFEFFSPAGVSIELHPVLMNIILVAYETHCWQDKTVGTADITTTKMQGR
jgi:hypothetical protein